MSMRKYVDAAERMWEKLMQYKDALDFSSLHLGDSQPWDSLCAVSPVAELLAREVESEYNHSMSACQLDWAVGQMVGRVSMDEYNLHNGTSLQPTL
jgi:hypothetical protein